MKKDANWNFRSFSILPRDVYLGVAQGKMDIENVSAFRRRILSTSVRQMPGNSVAEFAVTGVAFLWHQAWLLGSIRWGVEGDTESGIFKRVGGGKNEVV